MTGWKYCGTFILAAAGSAVGLGNIWKFPYITGENGGGAFVLVYLLCIAAIGIPVMIAEVSIGRRGRANPIDSMRSVALESGRSPLWALAGIVGVVAGLLIMMFYSVVAGWALEYVWQSASGSHVGRPAAEVSRHFGELTADEPAQIGWHALFSLLTAGVVAAGVTRGIGKAVEIMMPLLFMLLLVLVGYALAEGDFARGAAFLLAPEFDRLTPTAVLVALGHAFFTLSLGMGAIMTYGAYMPEHASVAKSVVAIAIIDTLVAIMAGLAIFPLVFSHGLEPGAGPGLMFVTLPIAFSEMAGGALVGTLFFSLVSIAALTSSISLIEPGVAWLEKRGLRRAPVTFGLVLLTWLGGLFCIHSSAVFDALDALTARYLLPLGGLAIALFVGWQMRRSLAFATIGIHSHALRVLWYVTLRFISPLCILAVFAHSLGLL
jgi:NSS family neurotransmitter:Na+ symporter